MKCGHPHHRNLPSDGRRRNTGRSRRCVAALFLLAMSLVPCLNARAGLRDGIQAFEHKEFALALREFLPLAQRGNAEAQMYLGQMYLFGLSVPRSPDTAFTWYRHAARQDLPPAQYNLANLYYDGRGVPKDLREALKWYRKAARGGVPNAQFNLGFMYEHGQGAPRDYGNAMAWYRKAARNGNAMALRNLGIMFMTGKGTARDAVKAYMWFDLAGAAGDKTAADARDRLAGRMKAEQIVRAKTLARQWTHRNAAGSN